jgi:uncharacterized membrane protein YsdA (DUF1294 family)
MKPFLLRHKRNRTLVLLFTWTLLFVGWYAGWELSVMMGLFLINAYSFGLAFLDKRAARRGRHRIPEASLWMTALFGGAAGLLTGMLLFRHKTKHASFLYGIPIMLCLQVLLLYLASVRLD